MFEASELTKEFEYQVYHRLGWNFKCDFNVDGMDLDKLFNKITSYVHLWKPNKNIYSYDW
jgi:hypothetical protein